MKQYFQIIFGILIGLLAAGLIILVNKPNYGEPISLSPAPTLTRTSLPKPTSTKSPILVQIKGEINSPGLYEFPENSRLEDLISAAGGLTDNANIDLINYALLLKDGDYIFIPAEGQEIPAIARNSTANIFSGQEGSIQYPIDINKATQEELEILPGIGPAKAKDIIAYRQMVGRFSSIEDLLGVSGIGPATLESLRDHIICEP